MFSISKATMTTAAVPRATPMRRGATTTTAAMRTTGVTLKDLQAAEKKRVVIELDSVGKVLIQEFMGDVYAVSNKCPHLGLSLQGKTPLLSAKVNDDATIVCPAHQSAFDLKTGAPKGEWCPSLPELPIVGKSYCGEPKSIATYATSVDEATGAISIDA
jgi:nitrite reductase/ring-hydroxylating ferredoxin subunit